MDTSGLTLVENEALMIREFIKIYEEIYKDKLSSGVAKEKAQKLLNAYKIVYRIPQDDAVFVLNKGKK